MGHGRLLHPLNTSDLIGVSVGHSSSVSERANIAHIQIANEEVDDESDDDMASYTCSFVAQKFNFGLVHGKLFHPKSEQKQSKYFSNIKLIQFHYIQYLTLNKNSNLKTHRLVLFEMFI